MFRPKRAVELFEAAALRSLIKLLYTFTAVPDVTLIPLTAVEVAELDKFLILFL